MLYLIVWLIFNLQLIIPSLPGYGFSSAAGRTGLSPTQVANILKRLMSRLGHDKFFIMGGDWGALITSDMATIYPDKYVFKYMYIRQRHSLYYDG